MRKENEILRKKNEWLTSSLSIFSCGQKSFEMILASQKCVFDKQGLGFKSSKNPQVQVLLLFATFVEEEDTLVVYVL